MTSTANLPRAKSDGDGLTFTLSKAGTASWILRYRLFGKARELTLGNYPDISLAEARKLARRHRVSIDEQKNPAAEKRLEKLAGTSVMTLRGLIADYRLKILPSLGESTQRSYGRNLTRLENALGPLPVNQIDTLAIVGTLRKAKLPWVESSMLLTTAKVVFRHAIGLQVVAANPCAGIELSALLGKRPKIRERLMLSAEEIGELYLADMARANQLAVLIMLATAVRISELTNAQWSDVDLAARNWKIPTSKTGLGMDIPLARQVKEWFVELKRLSQKSAYVLPARVHRYLDDFGADLPISKDTIRSAIYFWLVAAKPPVRRFTPHDLRSTAKSHMRKLGVPGPISEMCLNHKVTGVEGIYDRHSYYEERREALQTWADFLADCEPKAARRLAKAGRRRTGSKTPINGVTV